MKRVAMVNKGCVNMTLYDTSFSDSWFSHVKTAEDEMATEVDYCGPVKTSHKVFCLATCDERLARKVISCYVDYYKISWWLITPDDWVQLQL